MFKTLLNVVALAVVVLALGGAVAAFAGLPAWTAPVVGPAFCGALAYLASKQ